MNIKKAQTEALKQINTTFKLSEIGYGQGYHEGKMNERKYWKYKIKAKIEECEREKNSANRIHYNYWNRFQESLQSLLEKE